MESEEARRRVVEEGREEGRRVLEVVRQMGEGGYVVRGGVRVRLGGEGRFWEERVEGSEGEEEEEEEEGGSGSGSGSGDDGGDGDGDGGGPGRGRGSGQGPGRGPGRGPGPGPGSGSGPDPQARRPSDPSNQTPRPDVPPPPLQPQPQPQSTGPPSERDPPARPPSDRRPDDTPTKRLSNPLGLPLSDIIQPPTALRPGQHIIRLSEGQVHVTGPPVYQAQAPPLIHRHRDGYFVNDAGQRVNTAGRLVNERDQLIDERGELLSDQGGVPQGRFEGRSATVESVSDDESGDNGTGDNETEDDVVEPDEIGNDENENENENDGTEGSEIEPDEIGNDGNEDDDGDRDNTIEEDADEGGENERGQEDSPPTGTHSGPGDAQSLPGDAQPDSDTSSMKQKSSKQQEEVQRLDDEAKQLLEKLEALKRSAQERVAYLKKQAAEKAKSSESLDQQQAAQEQTTQEPAVQQGEELSEVSPHIPLETEIPGDGHEGAFNLPSGTATNSRGTNYTGTGQPQSNIPGPATVEGVEAPSSTTSRLYDPSKTPIQFVRPAPPPVEEKWKGINAPTTPFFSSEPQTNSLSGITNTRFPGQRPQFGTANFGQSTAPGSASLENSNPFLLQPPTSAAGSFRGFPNRPPRGRGNHQSFSNTTRPSGVRTFGQGYGPHNSNSNNAGRVGFGTSPFMGTTSPVPVFNPGRSTGASAPVSRNDAFGQPVVMVDQPTFVHGGTPGMFTGTNAPFGAGPTATPIAKKTQDDRSDAERETARKAAREREKEAAREREKEAEREREKEAEREREKETARATAAAREVEAAREAKARMEAEAKHREYLAALENRRTAQEQRDNDLGFLGDADTPLGFLDKIADSRTTGTDTNQPGDIPPPGVPSVPRFGVWSGVRNLGQAEIPAPPNPGNSSLGPRKGETPQQGPPKTTAAPDSSAVQQPPRPSPQTVVSFGPINLRLAQDHVRPQDALPGHDPRQGSLDTENFVSGVPGREYGCRDQFDPHCKATFSTMRELSEHEKTHVWTMRGGAGPAGEATIDPSTMLPYPISEEERARLRRERDERLHVEAAMQREWLESFDDPDIRAMKATARKKEKEEAAKYGGRVDDAQFEKMMASGQFAENDGAANTGTEARAQEEDTQLERFGPRASEEDVQRMMNEGAFNESGNTNTGETARVVERNEVELNEGRLGDEELRRRLNQGAFDDTGLNDSRGVSKRSRPSRLGHRREKMGKEEFDRWLNQMP